MILVTLVLPRSRFPMAVHHNKDVTCDVSVVGIGKERGLILTFACLLSLCHLGLFSLYAIMAKGWHSPTSSPTQQVHSSLVVHTHGHGQPRFTTYYTAPPGVNFSTAQVRKRVDSCHSPLNLGQCARSWSSAHVPKASHIEAVHKLHQHFRPFACEMLRAQVRRVCFRRDLLHRQRIVADRLLEPQVLNFLCALLCPSPFCLLWTVPHWSVNVQSNRDGSTQVFGECLNCHRLCCCAVASIQFCFGGAGGDNALLLRPSFDQVLPVQDHAHADRLS